MAHGAACVVMDGMHAHSGVSCTCFVSSHLMSFPLPLCRSAYTFTYVCLGEIAAWFIGWNLTLEYAISAAGNGGRQHMWHDEHHSIRMPHVHACCDDSMMLLMHGSAASPSPCMSMCAQLSRVAGPPTSSSSYNMPARIHHCGSSIMKWIWAME